jgi:hypothetical protein
MRGGVQVWRRGLNGHGIRHATAYALQGGCDAEDGARQVSAGADAAVTYGPEGAPTVTRHTATTDGITTDQLDAEHLRAWIDGADPATGEQRGRSITSPEAHLLYDATINTPKTYSLAAILDPELRHELDSLMDRVTAETVTAWQDELCTRRGKGGRERVGVAQIEVVQLDHERSRSLDPHAHRHLWLNAKVQGEDGKWSNVDSQQVFRHQVLVNARGELAARTDARWRAALTAHGYTLDRNGEIEQLAHLVAPMSKRAAQIQRNKDGFEAEWRHAHPGEEPSPRLMESWDRRAWALDRAQKPEDLDEDQWRDQVRREIANLDPALVTRQPAHGPVHDGPAPAHNAVDPAHAVGHGPAHGEPTSGPAHEPVHAPVQVDRDQLTAHALSWTDQRAVRSQGRFSRVDLRAGATMAVASAQLVRDPADLDRLISEIETRALLHCESLAPSGSQGPDDVKALRLTAVGETRARITERAAVRAAIGDPEPATKESLGRAIATVDQERATAGEDSVQLDDRQVAAARAIAGTSPLVVVEGPAGAGKTTMLTVAERAIDTDGHRMVTVAPTMKAAQVAEQEIGADGSSLHALLHQHGYRWTTDPGGRTHWHRLEDGELDSNGIPYHGPSKRAQLSPGDLIVCDEAGMVDLDAMHALLTLADDTGARLALVGDPHQVRPVGHSGGMALVQAQTPDPARVDLHSIHRFRKADDPRQADTAYAEITRDMRNAPTAAKAREVASWLDAHDHLTRCTDSEDQIDQAVTAWMSAHGAGETIAVMADDNETVDAINERIQQARLTAAQLTTDRTAAGRDGQVLRVGDQVTTRKNHRDRDSFSVANREQWTIRAIAEDGTVTVTGGIDQRTEQLPADYATDHLTLGYASTVHGAQGVTARHSVTVLADTTTSAQLYVGMTRGKHTNQLLVTGGTDQQVLEQVGDAIMRDRHDLTDAELRQVVAGDIDRAGATTHPGQAEPGSWRERTFGDVPDPGIIHDRLTVARDKLTAQVRTDESSRHVLDHELRVQLRPAVDVAHRDGLDPIQTRAREMAVQKAEKTLQDLDSRLTDTRRRLARTDQGIEDIAREIEHRATLSPENAHREQTDREDAAVHEPARPTDTIRRPFGLTPSIGKAGHDLDTRKGQAEITRDRATARKDAETLAAADARATDQKATAAAREARTRYEHELDHHTTATANQIRTDLDHLARLSAEADTASMFRRRSARTAANAARTEFETTWGPLPTPTDQDGWIQARAAEHAEDLPDVTTARDAAEKATVRSQIARRTLTRAERTEDELTATIQAAQLELRDIDAQRDELAREARLRAHLPEDVAAHEDRLRHARAAKTTHKPASGRDMPNHETQRRSHSHRL